ncbi:LPXTG cell wall anchor domain-containing protein [Aerococcus christensenii]
MVNDKEKTILPKTGLMLNELLPIMGILLIGVGYVFKRKES